MSRRFAALAFAALMTSSPLAEAQAPPFECGPDCTRPGRFVECIDGFDGNSMVAGTVVLGPLDMACATIPAPASTFRVTAFAALLGPGEQLPARVEIYAETGTVSSPTKLYETGAAAPFSNMVGFTGLFFAPQTLTDDFRLCLRQQYPDRGLSDPTRPVAFDSDGMQGTNTMILAERSNPPHGSWHLASDAMVTGDFVIRAIVEHTENMSPWEPGGECSGNPRADSGVLRPDVNDPGPFDSGTRRDAFVPPVDSGATGVADSGAPAPQADASVPQADGGVASGEPPKITAITPTEGPSTAATDIIITGEGFQPGLTVKIGAIPAADVEVPGASTALATVAQGILPGVYDVVVQNPDGQAAVLPQGYTVTGDDGCSCSAGAPSSEGPRGAWAGLMLLAIWISRRAGSRRS